jgi:plastocyanin
VSTGKTCFPSGSPESAIFFVTGFSSKVTDAAAPPPLEARVKVGERVKVGLQLLGCGSYSAEAWSSQNTAVGVVTQDSAFSFDAEFLAVTPGTTTVFVDFTATDNKRHRTTLGYCADDAQSPGFPSLGCENPKLIGTVRVVE